LWKALYPAVLVCWIHNLVGAFDEEQNAVFTSTDVGRIITYLFANLHPSFILDLLCI
jgi:hypothetical protein